MEMSMSVEIGDTVEVRVLDIGWQWKRATVMKLREHDELTGRPIGARYGFLAEFDERRLGTAALEDRDAGTAWRAVPVLDELRKVTAYIRRKAREEIWPRTLKGSKADRERWLCAYNELECVAADIGFGRHAP
jgi:hypothetical protein